MMRRLFTLASGLSLLLITTSVVLWVWSAFQPIAFSWGNPATAAGYTVALENSWVSVQRWTGVRSAPLSQGESAGALGNFSGWISFGLARQRFDVVRRNRSGVILGIDGSCTLFAFHVAWPLLLGMPLSARIAWLYAMRGTRRNRRIRQGLCPLCGYDLRATPDRCPECGHVPECHYHPI